MTIRAYGYISNDVTNEQVGLPGGVSVSQTASHEDGGRVSIATTETTITFDANIGDAGYLILINRDDTNFVQIGFATTEYVLRLKPGEFAIMRLEPSIAALYCKADTAAVDLQFKVFED